MSKKVYLQTEGRQGVIDGVTMMGEAVASTLGPTGKSVIIRKTDEKPIVTKDGVTVAKNVESDDALEQIGIMMTREAAINMDDDSGDGTTSATIFCWKMIKAGMDSMSEMQGLDMISYCEGMKTTIYGAIDYVNSKTVNLTKGDSEKLKQIATISANNDSVLGNLIAKATDDAGQYGHVNIQESNNSESRIDIIEGFLFSLGLADFGFSNNRESGFFESKNAVIVLKNDKLIEKKEWKRILNDWDKENSIPDLVIIAKDFSQEILGMAKQYNSVVMKHKICLIRNGFRDNEFASIYDDIAAYTGARIVEEYQYPDEFGSTKNIVVKPGVSIMQDSKIDFSEHLEFLKAKVVTEQNNAVSQAIKQRIGRFENGIVTVFIGGKSDVEVKEKKDRAVDAYSSCKAAIDEGIVIGGGHTLMKYACLNGKSLPIPTTSFEKGRQDTLVVLMSVFKQIYSNSNTEKIRLIDLSLCEEDNNFGIDFKNITFCNLMESGIIDPKKTVVNALLNAYSVASTILNTECVII